MSEAPLPFDTSIPIVLPLRVEPAAISFRVSTGCLLTEAASEIRARALEAINPFRALAREGFSDRARVNCFFASWKEPFS